MSSKPKSREDVEKLLAMAKIDMFCMGTSIQNLCTGSSNTSGDVIFVELDPLAAESLKSGQRLVIRGKVNDLATCCSYDKTFEMKEAETSNSLLLFKYNLLELITTDRAIHAREVECLKKHFYEMKLRRPITKRLKEKLNFSLYDGTQSQNGGLSTFEDLLEVTGCSEVELNVILRSYGACSIEGYWRIFDFDYLCLVFRSLLAVVDEAGWSYCHIPIKHLTNALSEMYIIDIVNYFISIYTHPLESAGYCCLHEDNVCRMYAEMILRAAIKFDLSDFKQSWQLSVPEGLITSFGQIKNIAILDMDSKPETIRYFPILSLPDEISDRFQALFSAKEKWTLEEIMPYLEDLCSGPKEVTKLLLKHARMSTFKDVRVYSRRL